MRRVMSACLILCGVFFRTGLVGQDEDRLPPELWIHVTIAEVKFWESPDFIRAAIPWDYQTRSARQQAAAKARRPL